MKRSRLDSITKLTFGQDNHAVFAEAEKGQKHLVHLEHGGEYTLGPAFDAVFMPTYWPDPVRRAVTVDASSHHRRRVRPIRAPMT